jgi:hypothetical protein
MIRLALFLTFTLAVFAAAGCQSEAPKTPPPAKRYDIDVIRYYVRYISAKKEIQADVNFQLPKADSKIPPKFFFADQQMEAKKLPNVGTMFRYVQSPANFVAPFVFRYTEADGSEVRDTLNIPLLQDLRIGSKNLSLSKGGVVAWSGEALTSNDLLRIIITDASGSTTTINHVGATPVGNLPLPLEQIATLPKGEATFSISLTRSTAAQHISRKIEYYFEDFKADIVP